MTILLNDLKLLFIVFFLKFTLLDKVLEQTKRIEEQTVIKINYFKTSKKIGKALYFNLNF